MKSKMIISNVRMPEQDWLQIKAAAGEIGMSVNQYIKYAVDKFTVIRALGEGFPEERKKKQHSIWDLPKAAKNIKAKPMRWSKEDEAIYGF